MESQQGQEFGVLLLEPCSLKGKRPWGLEELWPGSHHQLQLLSI